MKTNQIFSFTGLLVMILVLPLLERTTEAESTIYQIEVSSINNESLSFNVDLYYINENGQKIEKSEELTTPYKMTVKASEFRGIFEKKSEMSSMKISVKDGRGSIIGSWNKTVIEIENGNMKTWGIN